MSELSDNNQSQPVETASPVRPRRLQASTVVTMTVVRAAEMGAFLDAGTGRTNDDILLHNNQQTRPVAVGDDVDVFLYRDPAGRLAASMRLPRMKEGQIARLRVINVDKDGAYLDVGAERGIFLPYAGMRGRPKVGEIVWAKLYTDKSGRLACTMIVDDEIRRAAKPAVGVKVGDELAGTVYNLTEKGAFVFSDERFIIFIDDSEMAYRPKVGETVKARVTFLRDDGRLNGSLRPVKEKAIDKDAAAILTLLEKRRRIPYGDDTSPQVIRDKFHISKAAFKRALGHLLKQGKVVMDDGWMVYRE